MNMINKSLFKKAKYYYNSGMVHKISSKPNRIIMEVGDEEEGLHSVIIESKGYLSLNCDCTYGSVKSKYNVICSHGLAVLLELTRIMGK